MSKHIGLVVLVFLVALTVAITPTYASTSQEVCEQPQPYGWGGIWDEHTGTCLVRSHGPAWMTSDWVEAICGEVKNTARIIFEPIPGTAGYWWWLNGCTYSALPTAETAVSSGSPVDAFYGNCGIHIPNPPLNGKVVLSKERNALPGFIKAACTATYYDSNGTMLPGYGTVANVYINLDKYSYNLFMEEELDLFTYNEVDGWTACGAAWMELEDSDYGRLYCTTDDPTYGLGRK